MKTLQIRLRSVSHVPQMWTRGIRLSLMFLCCVLLACAGCKGTTISPTTPGIDSPSLPSTDDLPESDDPDKETPIPKNSSCDNYADSSNDRNLPLLEADGASIMISMECAGDVDWYKIELSETPVKLEITLTGMLSGSDFDLTLFNAQQRELDGGRSSESGSRDENISLIVEDAELYLQIYSFSGRGEAILTAVTGEVRDVEHTPGREEFPEIPEEEPIEQLTYEQLLSSTFWFYPRGTNANVLERSVETVSEESISCRFLQSEMTGQLTIGNYAHVERDLLKSVDYIDGWALVVFNGSKGLLDMLNMTIRVSIQASGLDAEVIEPFEMEIQGDDYLVTGSEEGGYYVSRSYGDLTGKSNQDLQIFTGVIGEVGEGQANTIFEQQVEVEWQLEGSDGTSCSGEVAGDPIADFTLGNFLFSQ